MDFGVGFDYEMPQWQPEEYPTADYLTDQSMGGFYSDEFSVPDWDETMGGMGVIPQAQMAQPEQIFQEPAAPSANSLGGQIGQQMQGGAPSGDDEWRKQLLKMGMGFGGQLLGAGAKAMFQPGQKKEAPLPQMRGGAPAVPDLEPLPGTKASPLISAPPTQIKMTQGLENPRKPKTGGFNLY